MKSLHLALLVLSFVLLCSCRPSVPEHATPVAQLPAIQPDYTDVTIPCNLCPINFCSIGAGDEAIVARLSTPSCSYTYGQGLQVIIDEGEWQTLLRSAVGEEIRVEVFARQQGQWVAYRPFAVHVAPDSIDRYLSYRLIPPSYVSYEEMIIEQRDLSSFTTREIYNTMRVNTETQGQCVNCHSYQSYGTERMLFHVRNAWGGTMIADHGRIRKVNLKRPGMISAGVYPAWHPTENLIAFSTNKTAQMFHTKELSKIEVFDSESDLILYDPETDQVSDICHSDRRMETFPTWSPDGRWLYYCVAEDPTLAYPDSAEVRLTDLYQEIRYDLYRKAFDAATRTWGEPELVYAASRQGLSVTLPRVSPDGRHVVFSQGAWGCFHVWHPDADIVMIDIDDESLNPQPSPLTLLNSPRSDSYPSFSSNGRWIMTASRRDDGNFTRPYISYFDREGCCHKAFEVPQESPSFYRLTFKSFNRPEFMTDPVTLSVDDWAEAILNQ